MRGASRWLGPLLKARTYDTDSVERVFIAIADHFEPFHKTDRAGGVERMKRWLKEYPESIKPWMGLEGLHPRHTHFFPIEQYDAEVVEMLRELCALTGSETEVHLHHKDDTSASFREKMKRGIDQLREHGFLSPSGEFCFVHGDWALANCHPEGKHCGVDDEIAILKELGCIADLTFPSAPSPTQPKRVNSIHYLSGRPLHEGPDAKAGVKPPADRLLTIQGITAMRWSKRKWGLLPSLENSDLTKANPPTPDRWKLWLKHAPRVHGKENWAFVKLHSHGATPWNSDMLLGEPMRRFREFLEQQPQKIHWVTAREMVNLIHAVENGARDFAPEMLQSGVQPPATRS
jgi:hypothetical protein